VSKSPAHDANGNLTDDGVNYTYEWDAFGRLRKVKSALIAPHRRNRRPETATQDGRMLRRYKRRWTVERTIAWFQNYRRLCIRWERSATLFQGFLHLSCSLMLLKQVLG